MIKKIIFLVLLVCLISPVMGETINFDYGEDTTSSQTWGGDYTNKFTRGIVSFKALELSALTDITEIDLVLKSDNSQRFRLSTGEVYYPDWYTDTFDFTMSISGTQIGAGEVTIINSVDVSGAAYRLEMVFIFESYDVTGYTGTQYLTFSIPGWEGNNAGIFVCPNGGGFPPSDYYNDRVYPFNNGGYIPGQPDIRCQTSTTYQIHQSVTYDILDKLININYSRNGYPNLVNVTGDDLDSYYYKNSYEDFNLNVYDNSPITIRVNNPALSEDWVIQIPETSTPGPVYDSIIHMSVYDAVTRNLINGHNVTLQYDDNSPIFTTWDGPISHTSIDWFNGQAANVTYSAEGYDPSPTHRYVMSVVDLSGQWLKAGESRTGNVYLNPIAPPSNVTAYAIFDVLEDMPNGNTFYSSGAAVTIGNTTLITAGQGSCSFELSPGNYQYIVKKVGYQTVSGSFVLGASNKYITVNLPKVQTAPTAPQPTGTAGVDYPYKEVNAREQAESSMGIIFDALPGFASLAVIVLVVSFVGWMTPKKRR